MMFHSSIIILHSSFPSPLPRSAEFPYNDGIIADIFTAYAKPQAVSPEP
jgi:hypothetical protein